MKTTPTLLALLACALLAGSCKKGKDDPRFTLLTRKQRLVGDWKMTKGTASLTFLDEKEPPINDYYKFDGSGFTLNETNTGGPLTVYLGKYSLRVNFKKDGTFDLSEQYNLYTMTATGTWNFMAGVGKAKNKENIVMIITTVTGDPTDDHLFNKTGIEFTYQITELKNKELAIQSSNPLFIGENGNRTDFQDTFTFTQ